MKSYLFKIFSQKFLRTANLVAFLCCCNLLIFDNFLLTDNYLLAATQRYFVDSNTESSGDGSRWNTAFKTLEEVFSLVQSDITEVWVKQGVYKLSRQIDVYALNIALYGGFAGWESERDQRRWLWYPSIIDNSKSGLSFYNHQQFRLDGFVLKNGKKNPIENQASGLIVTGLYANSIIANCIFENNLSNVIYLYKNSQTDIMNSLFWNNSQSVILLETSSTLNITNCTFASNNATIIDSNLDSQSNGNKIRVTNSILWGNTEKQINAIGSDIRVTYSNIQFAYSGVGNINNDPMFVNAKYGNFHLQNGSLCLDKGLNDAAILMAYDLDGNPRQVEGDNFDTVRVDMGAYEYQPKNEYTIVIKACEGGVVTPVGEIYAAPKSDLIVTVTPNKGFRISGMSLDLNPIDETFQYTFTNISYNHVLDICFSLITAPPVANAGNDSVIAEKQNVVLDASLSHDPDDGIASYEWRQILGTTDVTLKKISESSVTFVAPEVGPVGLRLGFEVTVTDKSRLYDKDNVYVTITNKANTYYVDNQAIQSGSGKSWGDAFKTVQEAISKAENDSQIYIKQGHYLLNEPILSTESQLSIIGGFAGFESESSQRNIGEHPVILDGMNKSPCFFIKSEWLIDGIEFKNFSSDASNSQALKAGYGGAIYISAGSNVAITKCYFENNSATYDGGAIYADNATLIISNSKFKKNHTSEILDCECGEGGAIFFTNNSYVRVQASVFDENVSYFRGGAICSNKSELLSFNNIFVGNSLYYKTNLGGYGAAVASRWLSQSTIINCTFYDNARFSYVGTVHASENSTILLRNSILWQNSTPEMLVKNAKIVATYCNIQGIYPENTNISQNPKFFDAESDDFRLNPDSPCIDSGNSDLLPENDGCINIINDPLGNKRIADGNFDNITKIDIGALEFDRTLKIIAPDEFTENGGYLPDSGKIIVIPTPQSDLVIELFSNLKSKLSVPLTVSLKSGQSQVSFPISVLDDPLLDGPKTIELSAQAKGYISAKKSCLVNDNEIAYMILELPEKAKENDGTLESKAKITVNRNVDYDIVVNITSSNPSKLSVPSWVMIPTGLRSVSFDLLIQDDYIFDGNQTITVTATVSNWTSGTGKIIIEDNDRNIVFFMSDTFHVNEMGGFADITVAFVSDGSEGITVDYATSDNTALEGYDYFNTSGSLFISSYEIFKTFKIPILFSGLSVRNKSINLKLSNPQGKVALGYPSEAVVNIVNDNMWNQFETNSSDWLFSIWGNDIQNLFASGENGTVMRFDGINWTAIKLNNNEKFSVWGSSNANVYAVGNAGSIFHYDGSAWSLVEKYEQGLYAIWGSSESEIFIVGANGTILYGNGISWTKIESSTTAHLSCVWGTSASSVFVGGWNGTMLHYDGKKFAQMTFPSNQWIESIWGISESNVYSVSWNGIIYRYDGWKWSAIYEKSDCSLYCIWGTSSNNIFALGSKGTLLNYNGKNWEQISLKTDAFLTGIWGTDNYGIFICGSDGTIIRYGQTKPIPTLYMSGPSVVKEGEGLLQSIGKISVTEPLQNDLGIELTTSDTTELSVPKLVTIAQNQREVSFDINIYNDSLIDGSQLVRIIGWATGFKYASYTVRVDDTETGQLLVYVPFRVKEGDGLIADAGKVVVAPTPPKDIEIMLQSGNQTKVSVPEKITVKAFTSFSSFDIRVADDNKYYSTQPVGITATVRNWPPATEVVLVEDNEEFTLHLSAKEEVSEDEGQLVKSGMIFIPATMKEDLTVNLMSSDLSEIQLPYTVTIAAGYTSTTFDITVINDKERDNVQYVTITATQTGWNAATATIRVKDNEPGALCFTSTKYNVNENSSSAIIDVKRVRSSSGDISVDYYVTEGSATANSHYLPVSGTLYFNDNETKKSFMVPILNIYPIIGNRTVNLYLTNPWNDATLDEPKSATLTITDSDTWTSKTSGTLWWLTSIWGASCSDVFAVGSYGTILHYDGNSWTIMTTGMSSRLQDIWGTTGTNVFAVGSLGTILHYNGLSWNTLNPGVYNNFSCIWGSYHSDIYVGGESGTLLHYDRSEWKQIRTETVESITDIWGTSEKDIFIVGTSGMILHYDGNQWQTMQSNTKETINAIWGTSSRHVLAVGNEGSLLEYDGDSWKTIAKAQRFLRDIWGTSGANVVVVGENTILNFDGQKWTTMLETPINPLFGVWGCVGKEIIAVGNLGTILHYPLEPALEIEAASRISEGSGKSHCKIRLAKTSDKTIYIRLTSSNALKIKVPEIVTIPPNASETELVIDITDNKTPNDSIVVRISGAAIGYLPTSKDIRLIDNDLRIDINDDKQTDLQDILIGLKQLAGYYENDPLQGIELSDVISLLMF